MRHDDKKLWWLAIGLSASLSASASEVARETAPATAETPPADVLARVNGESIYVEDVEGQLGRMHGEVGSAEGGAFDLDRLMFRVVNDVLLGQEARVMGLDDEAKIVDKVEQRREVLLLRTLERDEIAGRAEPTDDEIAKVFGEQYREVELRVVTAYDEAEALAMRAELDAGADMAKMARERSVDPIKMRDGLMQRVPRIELQREVAEVAFAIEPGQLGGPVATDLGFTVLRVEGFQDADPARLHEVRGTVRALLRLQKTRVLRSELARQAREHHPVQVVQEAVDKLRPERQPDARLIPRIDDPQAVVATVGDTRPILAEEYGKALLDRWKGVRNEKAAVAAAPLILERLIERRLLLAEAVRRGYAKSPAVLRALHSYETQLLVPRYLEQVVAADIEIERAELERYYAEHKDEFRRPPRLRLGQITVATLAEAQRLAGLLRGGADLAWLARKHSIDRFKDAGGDRGWYVPTPGADPFNEMLLAAETGDVLEPFGELNNFVVLKVVLREPQDPYPFDEVSGNVRQAVFTTKFRGVLDRYMSKLRERSEIEIFEDRLAALQITGAVESPSETEEGSGHGH